jgi:hypothetical protein
MIMKCSEDEGSIASLVITDIIEIGGERHEATLAKVLIVR